MSPSIHQGVQSFLEPRGLKLKSAQPTSDVIHPPYDHDRDDDHHSKNNKREDFDRNNRKTNQNANMGGWSFLQSLGEIASPNRSRVETERTDKAYTHPLVKRSSSKLSEKSLEMCTESLGSETGSESGDEISLLALEATAATVPQGETCSTRKRAVIPRSNTFPPPIKSISSSNDGVGAVKVRSYREDGRLVLRAVRVSSPPPYFQAERNEGRLRLSFSKEYENEEAEAEEITNEAEGSEVTNDDEENDDEDAYEDEEEEEEEEEAEEGVEVNNENLRGKMGSEKLQRPSSRCKEGGHEQKGLLNWEQFWVAT